jgi:Na+:H+ antiporter, NhaA family
MDNAVNTLDREVNPSYDHVLGPNQASITLVEYGSYDCPYCRAANEEIAKLRDRFGERMRYVFRQRPVSESALARRAAQLSEAADNEQKFWEAHVELMTRSGVLNEADLVVVERLLGLSDAEQEALEPTNARARGEQRLAADLASANASGVTMTPTFFINGRRYDGPWDEHSLAEAMLGSLGHRVQSAAIDFAGWAPSTGLLLLLATVLALGLSNSPMGMDFQALWQHSAGISFMDNSFRMPIRNWINDGLLSLFFLVVGLEIKREFTVGRLASRRLAALPILAAIGGMAVPAALFQFVAHEGEWSQAWGIPMATDTAFAVALIVVLGRRVPVELRVFLTAVAIVDDIGSILVIALFYSDAVHILPLCGAIGVVVILSWLNRSGVYRALPYALLGLLLWALIHASGLHATLAAVLLAWFIPTRPPPNLATLTAQAQTVINAEAQRGKEVLHHGASIVALRTLDAIVARLESPADRMLRTVEPWSSYAILPLFALANAGVVFAMNALEAHAPLQWAIGIGLIIGKPLGLLLGCAFAVVLGIAVKPASYSWLQLAGAGALAGIGFTMSLFVAGRSLNDAADFDAAKLAIFAASMVSALIGTAILALTSTPPVPDHGEADVDLQCR